MDNNLLKWVLNADVERTALIEEEMLLTQLLHADGNVDIPLELKGF